ncbi:MAG: Glu-tRNA(Gln) amidotransferase subunit GatE [Methanomicrobiales archaeon]|nr:Glu-tRNA(Gln) amidotransferase subunit GatE [Methanomicrobiales archaeon]
MLPDDIGLLAGIEIHQQIDSRRKLFCNCPTAMRVTSEHTGEFSRYLRATVSEMGEIDEAAREEMRDERLFTYYSYDTTCLVEEDDEPPTTLNEEALGICLQIAKTCLMTPVPQVHVMRKLVIDGSNTSGFQRTALVATDGTLPGGGLIETICLEEEAAQRVSDAIFSLDRLGIPLVEITTSPCMHSPREVRDVAEYLGMVLRSTGRVKRGLGTIRQDVNISISGGARVEIKGVQELDLIEEMVEREVTRQRTLLEIREELHRRDAKICEDAIDVSTLFAGTSSGILKNASCVLAVLLPGFGGMVGREIQPGRRLGSEISDYAKKCGVGGIFHTDELPAYGVTPDEVAALKEAAKAREDDCVIIIAADRQRAACAARQVTRRARYALLGVPEETRKMLEGGSTAYMRPLPGAARMYPETDILPVSISDARWESTVVPPLLTERAKVFTERYGLDEGLARQVAFSDRLPLFEEAVAAGIRPALAARTLLATLRELSRDNVPVDRIQDSSLIGALLAVEQGQAAKEALPDILSALAGGEEISTALGRLAPQVATADLDDIVARIVGERKAFVRERGMAALGPLMGIVMKEVRGSVDGQVVSKALKDAISRELSV